MGVRFPSRSRKLGTVYEHTLYQGAAGVGLVLLELAVATGDRRYRTLALEVAEGLVESTPDDASDLDPGLFTGHGGVALFHLAVARFLGDAAALSRARGLGMRLVERPAVDTDLLSGAAGSGLVSLALHHATGDGAFLEHSRRLVRFLADCAEPYAGGVAWRGRDPRRPLPEAASRADRELGTRRHTGLAHGSGGVCLFLLEHSKTVRDPAAEDLCRRGLAGLSALARWNGTGVFWPRSDRNDTLATHWCHGSAGIAQTYLALHRKGGGRQALEWAERAGEATWIVTNERRSEPACHCHGLSGAVELFLDLHEATRRRLWHDRAKTSGMRLARLLARPSRSGLEGAGLSTGSAGAVRVLLRLAGHSTFPILVPARSRIVLPSRPRSRPAHRRSMPRPKPRLSSGEWRSILPPLAVRLGARNRFVELGPPDTRATDAALRLLGTRPAGAAYFHGLTTIRAATERLSRAYSSLAADGALAPATFGPVLRDIAGMALRPGADPRQVSAIAVPTVRRSIAMLELFLRRLAADRAGALRGEVGGRLVEVELLGSDPHRGGQRVLALRFEDGPPLLYKPRSVAIDRELAGVSVAGERPTLVERLNGWLGPSVAGGKLPTHRLIAAGAWHGYAERVTPGAWVREKPADSPRLPRAGIAEPRAELQSIGTGEEGRFWYSAGLLAGHAFGLGIYDLHVENVVVGRSRTTPDVALHAVDLELAFGRVHSLDDTMLVERGPEGGFTPGAHTHAGLACTPSFECAVHAEDWALEAVADGARPIPRPLNVVRWHFPHLVRNPDGSLGYARNLCVFLRGLADQWDVLRAHAGAVEAHLADRLAGVPARVLAKPTQCYLTLLACRKLGGLDVSGATFHPRLPRALPLVPAEIAQLDALDVPYFFRFLGERRRRGVWWVPPSGKGLRRARELARLAQPLRFWSVVRRQLDPKRLAGAIVDAVGFVCPTGPFDLHDPALGVRVTRTANEESVIVIVTIGPRRDRRLLCRIRKDGSFEWSVD